MTATAAVPDRRRLLQLASAAATTLWLPRSAWSGLRLSQDPFALGVASGAPAPDGVVLWTRLILPEPTAQALTLRWEVAHDQSFRRLARSGQVQALPELAHTVHAEVTGLEADRWYWYRFMLGQASSPVGRTRTLPAPGSAAARLRLAYASCQRWEHGYYAAWRDLRAQEPDLVLFLGDYIYEYPGAAQAVRRATGGWVRTLADYRARYALHRSDADLRAMHAACPWLLTWDDHEVQNDYAGPHPGSAPAQPDADVSDFAQRRSQAYQAWYEHMPVRAAMLTQGLQGLARGAELRIYQQLNWGRLATLYMLDGRQYRDLQACLKDERGGGRYINPAQCSAWAEPGRSFLGAAQERWLDAALARSDTGWNVLGQQTLLGPRNAHSGFGQWLWNDGWDGYPQARQRLIDNLRRHSVANPVLLGGDVHENWVGHIKADYAQPRSANLGVEFCGTSISSRPSAKAVEKTAERLAQNPHFIFADAQHRGYGLAEFTPRRLHTTLRGVQDVSRADSPSVTLARFEVAAGRPQIERQ